jgi:hypothetical protein
MIHLLSHDIARQCHQELLAGAERYRLARTARERNARRQTASSKNAMSALFRRANGTPCRSEV